MRYLADTFKLDSDTYQLIRDGAAVDVQPQVFDLLGYLIEHRERVVARDELLSELWRGRVVSDSALNSRLKSARRAIGDDGIRQALIKTVHGRGYQFVGLVDAEEIGLYTGNPSASPIPIATKPSIVILPFANRSGDANQEFFVDGLTEDVINQLSRFRDLFVIVSHSSFAYKRCNARVQDICQELGVRFALEGSVQRSRKRVRIAVQLIDGVPDKQLWAERYEDDATDIFKIQDAVAGLIVSSLASGYRGRLAKAWDETVSSGRPENLRAYDLFQRSLDAMDGFSKQGIQQARELLSQAVILDPTYSRAYSKLAWNYLLDYIEGWNRDFKFCYEQGFKYSKLSVELDNNESWAHWSLAACYVYGGNHELGLMGFEKAVALNPNDPDVLSDYAYYLNYAGDHEQALRQAKKAIRLNPQYPQWYLLQLIQIYFQNGQYKSAIETFKSLQIPYTSQCLVYTAACYSALNDLDSAQGIISRLMVIAYLVETQVTYCASGNIRCL